MSQVKVEEQIGGYILYLKGRFIGSSETTELKEALADLAAKEVAKAVLSLEKVTYLNSTALGILISAHANFAKRGGKIILCNVSKSIENIFVITKLTMVFDITDSLDEAIKEITD